MKGDGGIDGSDRDGSRSEVCSVLDGLLCSLRTCMAMEARRRHALQRVGSDARELGRIRAAGSTSFESILMQRYGRLSRPS